MDHDGAVVTNPSGTNAEVSGEPANRLSVRSDLGFTGLPVGRYGVGHNCDRTTLGHLRTRPRRERGAGSASRRGGCGANILQTNGRARAVTPDDGTDRHGENPLVKRDGEESTTPAGTYLTRL